MLLNCRKNSKIYFYICLRSLKASLSKLFMKNIKLVVHSIDDLNFDKFQ